MNIRFPFPQSIRDLLKFPPLLLPVRKSAIPKVKNVRSAKTRSVKYVKITTISPPHPLKFRQKVTNTANRYGNGQMILLGQKQLGLAQSAAIRRHSKQSMLRKLTMRTSALTEFILRISISTAKSITVRQLIRIFTLKYRMSMKTARKVQSLPQNLKRVRRPSEKRFTFQARLILPILLKRQRTLL